MEYLDAEKAALGFRGMSCIPVAGWGRGMVKHRDKVEMGFGGSHAGLGLRPLLLPRLQRKEWEVEAVGKEAFL